jgi:hypothetical protein
MYPNRHLKLALSFANRRFIFTVLAVALFSTKSVRIYARLPVLSGLKVICWVPSLYAQDVLLLLAARFLCSTLNPTGQSLYLLLLAAVFLITTTLLDMAAITISFVAATGSEIHWRNIGLINDVSAMKMMMTAGSCGFAIAWASIILFSWLVQAICYNAAGSAVDVALWCISYPLRKLSVQRINHSYTKLSSDETEDKLECGINTSGAGEFSTPCQIFNLPHIIVGTILLAFISTVLIRPGESILSSLTWTLPLVPFVDFLHKPKSLSDLPLLSWNSTSLRQQNLTALREPPVFDWLPSDFNLSGFEDWYEPGRQHYHAAADPLRVTNLDTELLSTLRTALKSIDIRHVMIVLLESTRKDMFPVTEDGMAAKRLAASYPDEILPDEIKQKLAALTPNAKYLTGGYDTLHEAEGKRVKGRGGIRASNAFTSASYTLKSLIATLCGIAPLSVDFNEDGSNHIYQPCLPHILEAFNQIDGNQERPGEGFTSFKWRSTFVQSVTGSFDRQDPLMTAIGYANESYITKEYLNSDRAKLGNVSVPDINYFGMPEVVLEEYIRDAFATAKLDNERVFLTHVTSTTHHPFDIPLDDDSPQPEDWQPEKRDLDDVSKYLNAIGYVDKWLGKILDILDEQGVADETLVIFVGDHGLSLVENDAITPYDNPHVANLHVPLVLSHPKLPEIDIQDAVLSFQILPTILDLLLETEGLSESGINVAQDLIHNYEGQSLLRPLRNASDQTGQAYWQFSVMNPGGSMLAVRDAREPHYRLVVPLMDEFAWRFTDLRLDPHEEDPIASLDVNELLRIVERDRGSEASLWIEGAASVSQWWLEENHKRWRYGT